MEYRFQCTIEIKRFEKPCTVRLVDGFLAESVDDSVWGTVYQIRSDGSRAAVCQLQHTVSFMTEDMWTKIRYQDGCLTHHAYYDAPVFHREDYSFPGGEEGFVLDSSPGDGIYSALEYQGQRYPILYYSGASGWNDPVLMVCKPESECNAILAKIILISDEENHRQYDIRMNDVSSPLLRMAICSLALTKCNASRNKRESSDLLWHFQRVAGEPQLPQRKTENGSEEVRGLDNEEYHGVWSAECSTVYQLRTDGRRLPVARIQDVVYYWGDFASTKIFYSSGCLTCTENQDVGVSLHHAFFSSEDVPEFMVHEKGVLTGNYEAVYERTLEYQGVHYPIRHERDKERKKTEITVYRPHPNVEGVYTPLAKLRCIDDKVWDIQMHPVSDPILCIAICSLRKY